MVTSTLDQGQGLGKTHFSDIYELLVYLNRAPDDVLSETDSSLNTELDRRDKEMDDNPSASAPSIREVIEFARTGK